MSHINYITQPATHNYITQPVTHNLHHTTCHTQITSHNQSYIDYITQPVTHKLHHTTRHKKFAPHNLSVKLHHTTCTGKLHIMSHRNYFTQSVADKLYHTPGHTEIMLYINNHVTQKSCDALTTMSHRNHVMH